jgi:hypothetical protein
MAATILRDPFAALIRKIGYSAGLENTRERIGDLVKTYAQEGQVTTAMWRNELVEQRWGLKTHNISDVFFALNLIHVHQGVVDILYGLDGLAIAREILGSREFEAAVDAIFCLLILVADADIFLNCLATDFEPEAVRTILLKMINSKRALAHEAIRLTGLKEKVDRIINIDTQRTNRGSSGSGKGVNLLTRTQPLAAGRGPLARSSDTDPFISEDYLRKVPPKRKEWARSIGLFDDTTKTLRGERLLQELAYRGLLNSDNSFALWPFMPELTALHLTPSTAPWPTIGFEDLCELISLVFSPNIDQRLQMPYEGQLKVFLEVSKKYRSLNIPKSALRGELPIRVAALFQLGWNTTSSERLSFEYLLNEDRARENRRIEIRSSRIHEGALIFRRGE